jgi:D-alanyl-lipoteichoic acid acyltransferase DltB (MBOAT superfamily)
MMPQFDNLRNKVLNYRNISQGLCLFFIGLLKKVAIADTFAVYANKGFADVHDLTFMGAWITSLSYTLQLYFDFSGYTDMAIGSSLLFNIRLPNNFNAPYRALDIQDFWRRWHITLSNFLRDYIYIPLGGSRVAEPGILANLLFTFLIGGIWHGAGWTFVIWGLLHGCAMVVHRLWKKLNLRLPALPAWLLTFGFVNVAWVFFRAGSPDEAVILLKAMAGMAGATPPSDMETSLSLIDRLIHAFHRIHGMTDADRSAILLIAAFTALSSLFMSSNQIAERFRPTWSHGLMLFVVAMYAMLNMDKVSEFLYFNF